VVEGAGHLPRKNNCFVPRLITLTQFLIGISLGTRILRFSHETKLTKTVQKFTFRPGGGAVEQSPPPEYATDIYFLLIRLI